MTCSGFTSMLHTGANKMSLCQAFNKFHSPCFNHPLEGKDVCYQHQNFYDQDIWCKRFPLSPIGIRLFYFSSSSKIKQIYNKAIMEGRVRITMQHFLDLEEASMGETDAYVDYYLFCCGHPDVDPLWSGTLFKRAIHTILGLHKTGVYETILNDKKLLTRLLDPIFNSPYRSFSSMLFFTFQSVLIIDNKRRSDVALNLDRDEISLIQYIKAHPKFKDFLLEHSDKEDKMLGFLEHKGWIKEGSCHEKIKKFFEGLSAERALLLERMEVAMAPLRTEIVEAVWHPSMFMDFREYQDLESRWSGGPSASKYRANIECPALVN